MNILFIGYYFDPYPGVGAKRISYWADEITKHGIQPTVITTIEQEEKKPYSIHVVPNTNRKRMLSRFIRDVGYSWELDIIDFIDKGDLPNYDFVLISGGPFMQMGVVSYFKKRFPNIKIILDFRDPFAINPRDEDFLLKKLTKQYFEKRFCKNANAIITVNHFCSEIIQTTKKVHIIENGYDERVMNSSPALNSNDKFTISHAGSLYEDRDPSLFLQLLSNEYQHEIIFEQYGNDTAFFDDYRSSTFLNYKGKFSYEKLIGQLNNSDACILFTLGKAFESTTKIFDYIALNKKILIITEGESKTGNLHEITKNYPNVIWSKNNQEAIKKAIEELKIMDIKPFDALPFSRNNSLKQLVNLLNSIK